MKKLRMLASFAIVGAVIAGVLLVPLPSAVFAPVELKAHAPHDVYTETEGVLTSIDVLPGQQVQVGDPLATLMNIDTELKIERLRGEISQYEARLRDLDWMSLSQVEAAEQREQVREMLTAARAQLEQAEEDAARLVILAPAAGTVLPPSYKDAQQGDEYQLRDWHGTPLDKKNLGATLPVSTHVCQIVDPRRLEALIVIDESEETDLLAGRRVELLFKQSTDYTFVSRVREVSGKTMEATPPRLSSLAGGDVPTEMDPSGVPRPMSPHVRADALLFEQPDMPADARQAFRLLRVGLTGKAKIHTDPRTLAERLYRYLSRTIKFDL